jgi:hypothetical protein
LKVFKILLGLFACSLLPTLPFAIFGYAGHDYPFHMASWLAVGDAWHSGILHPGWADRANYGFGDPRLCLYPPLSLFVGSVFCFILSFRFAPALFVSFSLFLSGTCMYFASRHYVAGKDRFTAALLYMYSPYLLMTAVNRFAAGEMLATAWLPLTLHYFFQVACLKSRRAIGLLGILLGLTLLTNVPASVVVIYCLAFVVLIIAMRQRSIAPILACGVSLCIAVGLAAVYLAPALSEKRYISSATLLRFDFQHTFITRSVRGMGIKGMQAVARLIAWVEFGLIIYGSIQLHRKRALTVAQRTLVLLVVVAFLFQLPVTTLLWRKLPELLFVQFSSRFLSISAAALPLILLGSGISRSLRKLAYAAIPVMACLPLIGYAFTSFEYARRPYLSTAFVVAAARQDYYSPIEYLPAGTTAPTTEADYTIQTTPGCNAGPVAASSQMRVFTTDSVEPCKVQLALFYYPYWQITDEIGRPITSIRTADGLLAMVVPPGHHTVRATFRATSPLRTAGDALSLVTALGALIFVVDCIRRRSDSSGSEEADRA